MTPRLAITGATGFLGGHLALAALSRGWDTLGVVRSPEKGRWLADRGLPLHRADLAQPDALAAAFAGVDVVIANAAMSSFRGGLDEMIRTNVGGTEATLRAAAAAGVRRVVLISSVALYRPVLGRAMAEDHERYGPKKRWFAWSHLTTDWRYTVSKGLAEDRAWELARELGIALTALRPGPIYGSRDPKWTARILRDHRRPVALAPTVGVPLVHAGDVATAAMSAAAALTGTAVDGAGGIVLPAPAGRAYNLAGPPASPWRILRTLRALTGRGPLLLPVPLPLTIRYDSRAAQADLGVRYRPLEEGLAEVLAGNAEAGETPGA